MKKEKMKMLNKPEMIYSEIYLLLISKNKNKYLSISHINQK